MEDVMKKLLSSVCVFLFATSLLVSAAYGQTAASVTWKLILPDSLNVSTIVGNVTGMTVTGTDSFKLVSYSGTVGGGPGPLGSNYCRFNPGVSWGPETGESAVHYVQFVAAPKTGANFTIDSASFWAAGGGTGSMRAFVYYSKDAAFTTKIRLTPAGSTSGDTLLLGNSGTAGNDHYYAFAVGITINSGQSFYLRIYPWYTGAASTSKYIYLQLAAVKGSTTGGTGVAQTGNDVPNKFELAQNYPNPFNPTTQISYNIPKESFVSLRVFNLIGQEVATLVSGNQTAGSYTVPFDASRLTSGVYMYRLQAGSSLEVKRMMYVK
jgi:hypothetical protein